MNELQKPLSEIEKAMLLEAANTALMPKAVMLLRRALFELDVLRSKETNNGR